MADPYVRLGGHIMGRIQTFGWGRFIMARDFAKVYSQTEWEHGRIFPSGSATALDYPLLICRSVRE